MAVNHARAALMLGLIAAFMVCVDGADRQPDARAAPGCHPLVGRRHV
jgi:hypothetical protein